MVLGKDENGNTVVSINGKKFRARPWSGSRTDVYGNNRACNCPGLLRLVSYTDDNGDEKPVFCVCYGRCYCPTCGHSGCVGGHD